MSTDTKHEVYQLYNSFIENCLLKDNSVLTNEEDIFSITNLYEVKKHFLDAAIDGNAATYWDKIKLQFQEANYDVRLCFAHLNWLWYLPADDIKPETKEQTPLWILDNEDFKAQFETNKKPQYFPVRGVGSAGQYHKTNKPMEINFLLILCIFIKKTIENGTILTADDINTYILENASTIFDENTFNIPGREYKLLKTKSFAMESLMMHLAKPDYYEAIASKQDKEAIKSNFYSLIKDSEEAKNEELTIDDEIHLIKKELENLGISQSFYAPKLWHIWNKGLHNVSEDIMLLQFKKALVYYGPPGTGKTHTAKELAESFITNHFLHKKENLKVYFEQGLENIEGRIHELQFNPNTSYEDFIAGYQLKATPNGSETIPVKGQLFNIIEKANNEEQTTDALGKVKLPHVLILDEINRVDLSRVFGELFSAMEYRNKPIQTAIKGIVLTVPDNLYIIGTMNEIDFSVERMDFALRRRFVWKFKGYNDAVLTQMLSDYFNDQNYENLRDEFVEACSALNRYISNDVEELGEAYQIGHTFFAELSRVHQEHYYLTGKGRSRKRVFKEAKDILWSISIEPMLEAFLGNTDKESVKEYTKRAYNLYSNGK
ncbi:AAA domain-containing protein [Bizionia gelidisalsuginis]|uniref:AAA domain-containing protein n=1 Tax=Bizionia gelidisalsuginis TaxID=291188 RepID=A0ABY3MBU1_9FLAO|nr:AAA family ATPase [Bizionia gelidisalsuginis]TYC14773.1 AAA domain-containing protein [Bizionia gelidisalsuginis]